MADLYLDADCYQAIVEAAVAGYPKECCGLLVGRRRSGEESPGEVARTVVEVVTLNNAWDPSLLDYTDPTGDGAHSLRDRYWIDPADMLAVQRSTRERGLEIIGVFHSHPDHVAVPSECDRTLAWPVYSYIIVSVMAGQVADFKSWQLNDQNQFEPEPVKMIGSSANKASFLS
ncbi:M67 family metallopeptidase [Nodosilinea sp. FACHB-13]|uniref:Mov34/MPN/PAD-1 family protein n=1 Tax=Cyanophyceae TaxID=3028117 RepID=UPI0016845B34|nr:M67 family metallopeptidase [Nodosilinea sp. FACHB-13]MBD2105833.1 M67 family metallopeptidase [Nodosilinea sp. FACHB-13]